jgi:ribosome-binding protein aMBF1 (putative translation factor)
MCGKPISPSKQRRLQARRKPAAKVRANATPILKSIGSIVRQRRHELGLNQKDAARIIGIHINALSRWKNGKYLPKPENHPAIAKFLGFDPWT